MMLHNKLTDWLISGCVEDVAVAGGQAGEVGAPNERSLLALKACSLPRRIDGLNDTAGPQWPTLQAGSIVSDYINNLDIVSHLVSISVFVSSLWRPLSCSLYGCAVRVPAQQ